METIYQHQVKTLSGEPVSLSQYQGKVLLIVNVASRCGLTRQYTGLQQLYSRYRERGFEILGFPCNQFAKQEPGDSDTIRAFCDTSYDVSFPMFEKIEVNGDGAHPLYQQLKQQAKGMMGTQAIKWNFTKFLVDVNGNIVRRFSPCVSPQNIASHIEAQVSS